MVLLCIRGSRKTHNKIESEIEEIDFEYSCFASKLWFESYGLTFFSSNDIFINSAYCKIYIIVYLFFKKTFMKESMSCMSKWSLKRAGTCASHIITYVFIRSYLKLILSRDYQIRSVTWCDVTLPNKVVSEVRVGFDQVWSLKFCYLYVALQRNIDNPYPCLFHIILLIIL